MEAEMSEQHQKWSGQNIAGKYLLGKYLGGTDHSAVFASEIVHARAIQVAIKLIPAASLEADKQLARWNGLIGVSHSNLLKILDCGKCELDGEAHLYVVQEYADEDLGDILPQRALNVEETRGMIEPAIEALAFLHGQNFVHARIHPGNVLAMGSQIKLASDSIAPNGEALSLGSPVPGFSAPEWAPGGADFSADIWSLGATVVAALTQKAPVFGENGGLILPEEVKEPFARIARESLKKEAAQRPTISKVRSLLNAPIAPVVKEPAKESAKNVEKKVPAAAPVSNAAPVSVSERWAPFAPVSPVRPGQARTGEKKSFVLPIAVAAIVAVLLFAGLKLLRQQSDAATSAAKTDSAVTRVESKPRDSAAPAPSKKSTPKNQQAGSSLRETSQPIVPSPAPATAIPSKTPTNAARKGEVLDQVLPDISEKARGTIQGKVRLAVRVQVNATGTVDSVELDTPASSKYFSEQAIKAAKHWQFSAPEVDGRSVGSQWLLQFEFTPSATNVRPAQVSP
jgi:TonB family protein